MAKGEFIGLMDNDDELSLDALSEVIKALNNNPKIDFIYSDEDKLNFIGKRCDPNFKPDFSPDYLLSCNYICHFTTIRKSLVEKIKGFRVGYEGAQDYDIFLRIISNISNNEIYHIPRILYHWRMIEGSTATVMSNKDYAFERGRKALQDFFDNKNIKCKVDRTEKIPYYFPIYEVEKEEKISIIIEHHNSKQQKNIKKNSDYKNIEVLEWEKDLETTIEKAQGKYIILMAKDVYLSSKSSLRRLLSYANLEHIGIVSPTLENRYHKWSGNILFKDHFEPITYLKKLRTTAVEAKLQIPVNYTVPSTKVICFTKEKYNHTCKEIKTKHFPNEVDMIQLCRNFILSGFFNMTDSSNEFSYKGNMKEEYDKEKYQGLNIEQDVYYNPNYSQHYLYKLAKWE